MEISQFKNYILKNLFTGMMKTILSLILSVVSIPIIISNIGIGNYGIISIITVFSSFTGMIDLGLSKGLIVFQLEKKDSAKEISAIYLINLCLFFLFFLLSILIYVFDINLMGENLEIGKTELRLINCVSVMTLSFGIFNNLLRASLEANFKLQLLNWGFLLQAFIINLGWLVLAIYNANIILFLFVPLVSTITVICYHLFLLPPIYTLLKKPDIRSIKNVFKITLQFFKVGALNSLHLPIIKYLIIYLIGDQRAIGIFELSTKLALLANTLLSYVSNPFFSIVSKHKEKSEMYLWIITKKVTYLLICITLGGYIVFIILNNFIITYFFNEYTDQIFKVLNMTVIGYLLIAASESVQKYFLGLGRMNLVAKVKFSGIIINLVIIIIFYNSDYFNLISLTFAYAVSLAFIGVFWIVRLLAKRNNLLKKI